jgi:hypothetical protein
MATVKLLFCAFLKFLIFLNRPIPAALVKMDPREHLRKDAAISTRLGTSLPQLTILAASAVIEFNALKLLFAFRLTRDTVSDSGYCPAARLGNLDIAFLTMGQTFPLRQPAFCQLHGGFHRGVYLFLHRLITGPANRHDLLLPHRLRSLKSASRSGNFFPV